MDIVSLIFAASTTLFLAVNYKSILQSDPIAEEKRKTNQLPKRSDLPETMDGWCDLFDLDNETDNPPKAKWSLLKDMFEEKYGVILWHNYSMMRQGPPLGDPLLPKPNGYNTLSHCISRWMKWCPRNSTQHGARTAAGCDVVIRVMSSGGSGENYRHIMRYLNQAPDILLSTNHILPMLVEMVFEHISLPVAYMNDLRDTITSNQS